MYSSFSRLRGILILLFLLSIISCRKEIQQFGNQVAHTPKASRTVAEWFGKIKTAAEKNSMSGVVQSLSLNIEHSREQKIAAAIISNLITLEENLMFDNSLVTEQDSKYNLLIIPIGDGFKEKKRVSKDAILHLVIVTTKDGKAVAGNIYTFYPSDNKKQQKISPQTIANFCQFKPVSEDGKIRILSLMCRWLREFDLKNGKIFSSGVIQSKSDSRIAALTTICTDWYLVTTYYDNQGFVVGQTSQYVGTTCNEVPAGEWENMNPDSDGGGSDTVTMDDQEIDGSTDVDSPENGPSVGSNAPTSIQIRYKFVIYYITNFYGLNKEIYYVDVHNAQALQPWYVYEENGDTFLMTVTLNSHQNQGIILTPRSCMAMWQYNLVTDYGSQSGVWMDSRQRRVNYARVTSI